MTFEETYNIIMDEIERKLNSDDRMMAMDKPFTILRGSPTEEPRGYPVLYIAEGQITDTVWDTYGVVLTIIFQLEFYNKSRDREEGVKDIRTRALKIFDTMVGTIADRRLDKDGISLANGENGVQVLNCDFGYFSPEESNIIYKGIIEVAVNVEVPLT